MDKFNEIDEKDSEHDLVQARDNMGGIIDTHRYKYIEFDEDDRGTIVRFKKPLFDRLPDAEIRGMISAESRSIHLKDVVTTYAVYSSERDDISFDIHTFVHFYARDSSGALIIPDFSHDGFKFGKDAYYKHGGGNGDVKHDINNEKTMVRKSTSIDGPYGDEKALSDDSDEDVYETASDGLDNDDDDDMSGCWSDGNGNAGYKYGIAGDNETGNKLNTRNNHKDKDAAGSISAVAAAAGDNTKNKDAAADIHVDNAEDDQAMTISHSADDDIDGDNYSVSTSSSRSVNTIISVSRESLDDNDYMYIIHRNSEDNGKDDNKDAESVKKHEKYHDAAAKAGNDNKPVDGAVEFIRNTAGTTGVPDDDEMQGCGRWFLCSAFSKKKRHAHRAPRALEEKAPSLGSRQKTKQSSSNARKKSKHL